MKKNDFPIFTAQKNLIYFDNAASTQKPQSVISAITNFYSSNYAPVHRGIYELAEQATELYENARKTVAKFINADPEEIVFTKNATESINFVASTWAYEHLKKGDEVVLTELEHHSNLIPWQQLAQKKELILKFIPVLQNGMLDYDAMTKIITKKMKFIAITHCSNAIGTNVDIEKILKIARTIGAKILIDAAQSAPHQRIDVKKINCDFLVFSGHKMLGPTGIGVLYINKNIQHHVNPYQFGGGMIHEASFEKAIFKKPPYCYEAGTPPVAQAVGLARAIDYLNLIDFRILKDHEAQLCTRLINGLQEIPKIKLFGPIDQLAKEGHLVSFKHNTIHSHDIAAFLSKKEICVRSGHYCAQPLAQKLGIDHSVRVSFYLYNTIEEVDYLLQTIALLN